jgi:hypothetical protein
VPVQVLLNVTHPHSVFATSKQNKSKEAEKAPKRVSSNPLTSWEMNELLKIWAANLQWCYE